MVSSITYASEQGRVLLFYIVLGFDKNYDPSYFKVWGIELLVAPRFIDWQEYADFSPGSLILFDFLFCHIFRF